MLPCLVDRGQEWALRGLRRAGHPQGKQCPAPNAHRAEVRNPALPEISPVLCLLPLGLCSFASHQDSWIHDNRTTMSMLLLANCDPF